MLYCESALACFHAAVLSDQLHYPVLIAEDSRCPAGHKGQPPAEGYVQDPEP